MSISAETLKIIDDVHTKLQPFMDEVKQRCAEMNVDFVLVIQAQDGSFGAMDSNFDPSDAAKLVSKCFNAIATGEAVERH